MVKAGFTSVFIGIETPNIDSLIEANKVQNRNRNLALDIQKIQRNGLEVMGGFIVGFDNDPPHIFDNLIHFVKESKIVVAMVGLLNAPPGTKLYKRLLAEGRIKPFFKGNNTDFDTNIIPKMDYQHLINGYKKIIKNLYGIESFYTRVSSFLQVYHPKNIFKMDFQYFKMHKSYIVAILKIIFKFGFIEKKKLSFWKLFFNTLFKKPKALSLLFAQIVSGYHIRKIYENHL